MDYKSYVEERLNTQFALQKRNLSDSDCLHQILNVAEELSKQTEQAETSLYEDICQYIEKINEKDVPIKFRKKSGKLDEKKFYDYARIGKTTWSNIRLNEKGISKESILKLVIALQLNEEQAEKLLKKASWSFNLNDDRDRVVIALLHIKCFVPQEAAEILESYGAKRDTSESNRLFENIYDMKKFEV